MRQEVYMFILLIRGNRIFFVLSQAALQSDWEHIIQDQHIQEVLNPLLLLLGGRVVCLHGYASQSIWSYALEVMGTFYTEFVEWKPKLCPPYQTSIGSILSSLGFQTSGHSQMPFPLMPQLEFKNCRVSKFRKVARSAARGLKSKRVLLSCDSKKQKSSKDRLHMAL